MVGVRKYNTNMIGVLKDMLLLDMACVLWEHIVGFIIGFGFIFIVTNDDHK